MTLYDNCLQFYNNIPASGYLDSKQTSHAISLYTQITGQRIKTCCGGRMDVQLLLNTIANYIRTNAYAQDTK